MEKFNLDLLAAEMQPMEKAEQTATIGGDYYYTPTGEYLDYVGKGDKIRVIDAATFHSVGCTDESNLNQFATLFSQAGGGAQAAIASKLADAQIYMADLPGDEAMYDPNSRQIYLSYSGSAVSGSNFYEICLVLTHELTHKQHTNSDMTTNQQEYMAYLAQKNDPYFSHCSAHFQYTIEQRLKYYKELVEKDSPGFYIPSSY